jgi:hypothetical protein
MKNTALLVRGSCLLALVGVVATLAGCEERVAVRHPQPAGVVVVRPAPAVVVTRPVVEERVIVR